MGIEMKKIGDIMVPLDQYPHVNHRATIREAIEIMAGARIDHCGRTSLPRVLLVFDDIHQLVGMARRRDILRGLEPKFLASKSMIYRRGVFSVETDADLTEIFFDKIISGMKEKADTPVVEVMQPVVMWVNSDDHVGKAIFEVVVNNVSILPVIKDKKVVGVVRTVDLLTEVRRLIQT